MPSYKGRHYEQHYVVKALAAASLLAVLLVLSACSTLMESGNNKKYSAMAESNYAAADMLAQQSRSFITTDMPLEISHLTDLDHPNEQTNFGKMVTQQIASRFVQLGYNVKAGVNTGTPHPGDIQSVATGPASAIITGRYAVAREAVFVNLRIIEAGGQGKILASYDYSIPKSRDVRELTKTQEDKNSFFDF